MPSDPEDRPYKLYQAAPRGLLARLRGQEEIGLHDDDERPRKTRDPGARDGWAIARRVLKYVALAALGWILLSVVLFIISAQIEQGNLPGSAKAALSSGGNMLTSTDTILIVGTDQRPKGSKEPGANTNDAGSRSDTLMLWRVGGGTSRRLSIPRDTLASIPGYGQQKINAAYAFGGPALTIKTVEAFTGVKINHVIVVNLAAFPKFIDAIGGIDVTTGHICSQISGGAQNGGFTLDLRPGTHHLSGIQALTLARTRENRCANPAYNASYNELTREEYQQRILNGIKSQLFSLGTFFRLPLASWDAPKVLRTDMGGFTLLSMFAAAELGGNAPVKILPHDQATYQPGVGDVLVSSPVEVQAAVHQLLNG